MRATLLTLLLLFLPALASAQTMMEAAESGDLEMLEGFLKDGQDPDAYGGWPTPLMAAAERGHTGAVALLLRYGATVDLRDSQGRRALLRALWSRQALVVQQLLAAGASPQATDDPHGFGPLLIAASGGDDESAALLLAAGADPNHVSPYGWTALLCAAQSENAALVQRLLESAALTDPPLEQALTRALHEAAQRGNSLVVSLLLEAGAAVDPLNNESQTPLLVAAIEGRAANVSLLLEAGAAPDHRDATGRTPLLAALWSDGPDGDAAAQLLAQATAEPQTALVTAFWIGHDAVVEQLLARGADPRLADEDGGTALAAVAHHGDLGWLERLEALGVDVLRDGPGALVNASRRYHLAVMTWLLERGVPADSRSAEQATPLLLVAGAGCEPCVVLLLQQGADPGARDAAGQGAEDYMAAAITVIDERIAHRGKSAALLPVGELEDERARLQAAHAVIRNLLAVH